MSEKLNSHGEILSRFMLGTDRVDAVTHRVTAADGTSFELTREATLFLGVLASRGNTIVQYATLLDEIWGATRESLEFARQEIAFHFGDDDRDNPHYVEEVPGEGYRLLQEVNPWDVPVNARQSRFFLLELSRRKVFRAAGAYCVAAFVALQISDATFDAFQLSAFAVRVLLVALIVGFPVTVLLAWFLEVSSRGVEKDPDTIWSRRMGRSWEIMALVSLCAASGVFAVMIYRAMEAPAVTGNIAIDVAVLRFDNFTGDPANDYLAHGVTEQITERLADVDGLGVVAHTSAFRYPDGRSGAREIAKDLGADYLVEGSLVRTSTSLRFVVQLINGLTEKHRWSDHFDFDVARTDEFNDRLVSAISKQLGVVADLGGGGGPNGADPARAYNHYLTARHLMRQGIGVKTLEAARRELDRAIAIGAPYRDAREARCRAQFALYVATQRPADFRGASRDCASAVDMGSDDADVLVALGRLRHGEGDYVSARSSFEQALNVAPNNADARAGLTRVLERVALQHARQGNRDAELEAWRKALAVSGSARAYFRLGRLRYLRGEIEQSIQILERGRTAFPDDERLWGQLGFTYVAAGRNAAGQSAFQTALRSNSGSDDGAAVARSGVYLACLGRLAEAAARAHEAAIISPDDANVHFWRAIALAKIGDEQRTISALRRAVGLGLHERTIRENPDLAAFHNFSVD